MDKLKYYAEVIGRDILQVFREDQGFTDASGVSHPAFAMKDRTVDNVIVCVDHGDPDPAKFMVIGSPYNGKPQAYWDGDVLTLVYETEAVPPPVPMSLSDAKEVAKQQVDQAAGNARMRFITSVPGQDAVYETKAAEADAYIKAISADPNFVPTKEQFPHLFAEVNITGPDVDTVARTIAAIRDAWMPISAEIEALRLSEKQLIELAETADEALGIPDAIKWPAPPKAPAA